MLLLYLKNFNDQVPENMRLCVIANGFQEDYMLHYLEAVAGKADRIDFLGSSIYPVDRIPPSVNFYDVKGYGVEGLSFSRKISGALYYYVHLLRFFLRKPRRGVVHIQWLRFRYLDGIVMPLLYKTLGYKLVYTVHDIVPHDRDTRFNRFTFRLIYRLNWKLIAHTEFIKERLIREFAIKPDKIKVIRHGVYEVGKQELSLSQAEAKAQLGYAETDQVILFFGFLSHYKGLDLLLDAFTKMKNPERTRLIVAGRVNEEYKQPMNDLLQRYSKENIRFILRRIDEKELPVLFQAAGMTVLPYREASQSGVLFMSYAYGIPVIAPDIGGFRYDVIDGKTGFLFRCGDAADLSVKMEMLADPKHRQGMMSAQEIRQYARANYSWEKSGEELINFIKS